MLGRWLSDSLAPALAPQLACSGTGSPTSLLHLHSRTYTTAKCSPLADVIRYLPLWPVKSQFLTPGSGKTHLESSETGRSKESTASECFTARDVIRCLPLWPVKSQFLTPGSGKTHLESSETRRSKEATASECFTARVVIRAWFAPSVISQAIIK